MGAVNTFTVFESGLTCVAVNDIPSVRLASGVIYYQVANSTERLALDANVGDLARQSDDDSTWRLVAQPASNPGNWEAEGAAGVPDGTLVDGNFNATGALPAAGQGDWFEVGTTGTIGGVLFTAREWWQANTATAGGNDAAAAADWTKRRDPPPGGGGGANLGWNATASNGTVTSDSGTNATITAVTGTLAGLIIPSQNTAITNNTLKVTNANHTGEVTGDTALTITNNAVTTAKINDGAVTQPKLSATGTGTAANFLLGDYSWGSVPINNLTDVVSTAPTDTQVLTWVNANSRWEPADAAAGGGAGDVTAVGTPLDNQIAVWVTASSIEGTTGLTYDGAVLNVTGDITLSGTVDGIDVGADVAANTAALAALVLDDLTDVESTAPADTQVLTWVGANNRWEPQASGTGGVTTWVALSDTPGAVTADAIPRGNTGGTALEFSAVIDNLADVDTTTSAPLDGQILKWVTANVQWEPDDAPSFVSLTDTPGTITANEIVKGNSGGTALQFGALIDNLADVDTTTSAPLDGQILKWVTANTQWEPADAPAGGGGAPAELAVRHVTSSTTTTDADNGGVIAVNAAADAIVTIHADAPEGFHCSVVRLSAANDVTIQETAAKKPIENRLGSNVLAGQFAMTSLYVDDNTAGDDPTIILGGDVTGGTGKADQTIVIGTAPATSGLAGGGDLSANRDLVVDIAGTTALGLAPDNTDEVLIWDGAANKSCTVSQLLSASGNVFTFRGGWDASVGTFPGGGNVDIGDTWVVDVGGTVDGEVFDVGDTIYSERSDTADANNSTTLFADNWVHADRKDAVQSVFSRTGIVVAAASDYDASQVDNDSGVVGTFVSDALNTLNTAVGLNTAKVTNATHTGDVTGDVALTIAAGAVDVPMMSATGTADATTYYRGDNTWSTPAGGATTELAVRHVTSSTTTTDADNGGVIAVNAAADAIVTIHAGAPEGFHCSVVRLSAANDVTIQETAAKTPIENRLGSNVLAGQFAMTSLYVDDNTAGDDPTIILGGDVAGGGGAVVINDLTDVDTSTSPPTVGQVLTWNDTNGEWEPADAAGGGGTPAGANTQLQYNASGAFGASANLTFFEIPATLTSLSIGSATGLPLSSLILESSSAIGTDHNTINFHRAGTAVASITSSSVDATNGAIDCKILSAGSLTSRFIVESTLNTSVVPLSVQEIESTNATGLDEFGGNLLLSPGKSTGASPSGAVIIQTTSTGASSSIPQTLQITSVFAEQWQYFLARGGDPVPEPDQAGIYAVDDGGTNVRMKAIDEDGTEVFLTDIVAASNPIDAAPALGTLVPNSYRLLVDDGVGNLYSAFNYEVTGFPVIQVTADYETSNADNGAIVVFDSATPVELQIPDDIAVGFHCSVVQKGAGAVTIAPVAAGNAVAVSRLGTVTTAGVYAILSLYVDTNPLATPTVIVAGDSQAPPKYQTVVWPGAPTGLDYAAGATIHLTPQAGGEIPVPANMSPGDSLILILNTAVPSTFAAAYKFPGGTTPTQSGSATDPDIYTCIMQDASNVHTVAQQAFS